MFGGGAQPGVGGRPQVGGARQTRARAKGRGSERVNEGECENERARRGVLVGCVLGYILIRVNQGLLDLIRVTYRLFGLIRISGVRY